MRRVQLLIRAIRVSKHRQTLEAREHVAWASSLLGVACNCIECHNGMAHNCPFGGRRRIA